MKTPILLAALLLSACSSGPQLPDWQLNAASATQRGSMAWLEGRTAVAEREFVLARKEVGSTGQPAQAIRVELVRCAAQVAALVFEPCGGYQALAADASSADQAYARYLAGNATSADAPLLPEPQRAVVSAASDPAAASAVAAIADPFSRMLAAGALFRANRATPDLVVHAINTASAQGWRRPLLAWLKVQLHSAEQANDTAEAARIRRRITLASNS